MYLDEFQSFLRLPVSAEEMLAKVRLFKLGMRLAQVHLDQLRSMPELHSAVMNNAPQEDHVPAWQRRCFKDGAWVRAARDAARLPDAPTV